MIECEFGTMVDTYSIKTWTGTKNKIMLFHVNSGMAYNPFDEIGARYKTCIFYKSNDFKNAIILVVMVDISSPIQFFLKCYALQRHL